jgi:hypothetical protein
MQDAQQTHPDWMSQGSGRSSAQPRGSDDSASRLPSRNRSSLNHRDSATRLSSPQTAIERDLRMINFLGSGESNALQQDVLPLDQIQRRQRRGARQFFKKAFSCFRKKKKEEDPYQFQRRARRRAAFVSSQRRLDPAQSFQWDGDTSNEAAVLKAMEKRGRLDSLDRQAIFKEHPDLGHFHNKVIKRSAYLALSYQGLVVGLASLSMVGFGLALSHGLLNILLPLSIWALSSSLALLYTNTKALSGFYPASGQQEKGQSKRWHHRFFHSMESHIVLQSMMMLPVFIALQEPILMVPSLLTGPYFYASAIGVTLLSTLWLLLKPTQWLASMFSTKEVSIEEACRWSVWKFVKGEVGVLAVQNARKSQIDLGQSKPVKRKKSAGHAMKSAALCAASPVAGYTVAHDDAVKRDSEASSAEIVPLFAAGGTSYSAG